MAQPVSPEKVYEACLVELHKSMRASSFYSLDHPALAQSLQRTLRYFQNLLQVTDKLEFTITKTQIFYGDKPLSGQAQVITALAGELFRRRMKKIIFLPGIEQKDFMGFLRAIRLEPDELAEKGGMEKMLAKAGVKAIWPNEVDFSRLDAVEEEEPEEEEEISFNLTPEQKSFRELLHQLIKSDDAEFVTHLKEVLDQTGELAAQGQHAEIAVAIDFLYRFTADAKKSLTTREIAEKAIRAVATREVLQVKITELMTASDDERARISRLMIFIGKATVPFILSALSVSEDRTARRNLSRTIVEFGAKAVPRAVELLSDSRWFVQRNILVILGEIGSGEILEHILPLVSHEDIRVAREAVKTVGRIGGESGLAALDNLLIGLDASVQAQIILLVGLKKWEPGRLKIEAIAKKRSNSDEVRIAGCEALGRIGNPESFQILLKVFKAKGWIQKDKRLPVRRAALKALVNYGSLAEPALLKAANESDSELQGIARTALGGTGAEVANEV